MGRNVSDIILPNDKYIIENYYFEGKGDRGKKKCRITDTSFISS